MNHIHGEIDDELRERAALYVLGSLDDDEARAYRAHLALCAACRAEVEALERVSGRLLEAVPAVTPPPGLFERALARARSARGPLQGEAALTQIWKRWTDGPAEAFTYVERGAEAFEPTNVPGISARKLFVDVENDRVTMLVRMEPGSAYPGHRHRGAEDCYVIQGDLIIEGERTLHGGDYVRAAPGSVHRVQSTRGGNVLLIVSSLGDEIVA